MIFSKNFWSPLNCLVPVHAGSKYFLCNVDFLMYTFALRWDSGIKECLLIPRRLKAVWEKTNKWEPAFWIFRHEVYSGKPRVLADNPHRKEGGAEVSIFISRFALIMCFATMISEQPRTHTPIRINFPLRWKSASMSKIHDFFSQEWWSNGYLSSFRCNGSLAHWRYSQLSVKLQVGSNRPYLRTCFW